MPDSLPDSVPALRLPGLCIVDFVESPFTGLSYGVAKHSQVLIHLTGLVGEFNFSSLLYWT